MRASVDTDSGQVRKKHDKVDFKKTLVGYRAPFGEFSIIEIPERRYLSVAGMGDPNGSLEFSEAIEALYPVAYKLKFASKNDLGRDYVVPPLEGLWWADDMSLFSTRRNKSQWQWALMLLVPDWIEDSMVDLAIEAARARNPPARLDEVRLETVNEGTCVQTLHIGSFDEEGPVLARMHHEFLPQRNLEMVGRHHEIYLSDFRRVEAEKRKTILRQPVEPV